MFNQHLLNRYFAPDAGGAPGMPSQSFGMLK
jgi:hypothetical protein